jgi:predicted flap endonuclease-1-like 5' DNA nuclease
MINLAETNSVALVIALLIGVAVGWWIFKRARGTSIKDVPAERIEPEAPRTLDKERPAVRRRDGREGNSLVDQGAAATTDVAGQVLGVQVHAELPGASGPPDNLEVMKGVGPKFVARLNENGIIRFDQLARLSANEIAILDDKMGPFKGRLERDRVAEQASYLARGDRDGFEARFGKLGGA